MAAAAQINVWSTEPIMVASIARHILPVPLDFLAMCFYPLKSTGLANDFDNPKLHSLYSLKSKRSCVHVLSKSKAFLKHNCLVCNID